MGDRGCAILKCVAQSRREREKTDWTKDHGETKGGGRSKRGKYGLPPRSPFLVSDKMSRISVRGHWGGQNQGRKRGSTIYPERKHWRVTKGHEDWESCTKTGAQGQLRW